MASTWSIISSSTMLTTSVLNHKIRKFIKQCIPTKFLQEIMKKVIKILKCHEKFQIFHDVTGVVVWQLAILA